MSHFYGTLKGMRGERMTFSPKVINKSMGYSSGRAITRKAVLDYFCSLDWQEQNELLAELHSCAIAEQSGVSE